MVDRNSPQSDPDLPLTYEIRVRGRLGTHWAEQFEGLSIAWDDSGDTLLTGPVVDQAALHSILRRVRDLGVQLISVARVEANEADVTDTDE